MEGFRGDHSFHCVIQRLLEQAKEPVLLVVAVALAISGRALQDHLVWAELQTLSMAEAVEEATTEVEEDAIRWEEEEQAFVEVVSVRRHIIVQPLI